MLNMEEVFYSKCTEFHVSLILENKNKISQLHSFDWYLNKHLDNIVLIESTHLMDSDGLYFVYEKLEHTFALHCE